METQILNGRIMLNTALNARRNITHSKANVTKKQQSLGVKPLPTMTN